MKIAEITPERNGKLYVVADDGRAGIFDVRPYLKSSAFLPLKDWAEFSQVRNGGYFVEWECGADLSADTIEAHWSHNAKKCAQQPASANATMRR